ncbi:hypothetical protein ACLKA6_008442 [Drosophila palustris]
MPELKPFLFKSIEKSLWRSEWEDWYRSFTIYADAEEITSPVKKRNKLLHLGGTQLQAVAYSLPGAIATLNEKEDDEEIYKVLVGLYIRLNIFHIVSTSTPTALTISELMNKSGQDEDIIDAITGLSCSWTTQTSNCYYPFRLELSNIGQILLRGTRLVIPQTLRPRVLSLAHEGHPGESAMKRRLRSKVWWPGIDRDVEKKVKACRDCLLVSLPDNPIPMKRHQYPTAPWKFVATDLLGPLPNNEYILVLIDYFSRYMDLTFLKSISSVSIIESMKEIFCRLGIPEYLRTDNGRQYVPVAPDSIFSDSEPPSTDDVTQMIPRSSSQQPEESHREKVGVKTRAMIRSELVLDEEGNSGPSQAEEETENQP